MSRNKKIAKGLGASALAVATLASGLSFGSAAIAAPEQETAKPSSTFHKLWGEFQSVNLQGNDNGPTSFFAFRTFDGSNLSFFSREASDAEAESTAGKVSALSTEEWRQMRGEGTNFCLAVLKPTGGRDYSSTGRLLCNQHESDKASWWKIDASGRIINAAASSGESAWLGGAGMEWEPFSHSQRPNVGSRYDVELGGEWAANPLSASVTFGDAVEMPATASGSTVANGAVEVREGSTIVARGTASADGTFSIEIPAPNKAGNRALKVVLVENGADKRSVDVTAAYGAGVAITGPSNGDDVMGPITVTGTAQAGSTATLKVGGGAAETVSVSANGQWSKNINIPRGETVIVASAKSKGANTTTSTVTVNPGDSSIAPLVIASPADGSTVSTDSKRVQFSGTAEPGARVQVQTQGATPRIIIDTRANNQGAWSQLGADLNFGVNYVLDTVYTPQGGASVRGTHRVALQEANPGVTQPFEFTTPLNNTEVIAPNKQVRLAGVGTTGTTVTVWNYRSKDRVVGTATVNKAGEWVIPAASLNNENTRYELHVEYTAPGQAVERLTHNITVKASNGVERPFDFPTPAEGSTVISPTGAVDFSGTATTGTEVTIWNFSSKDRVVATAKADETGAWKGTGQLNNMNGEYFLHVEYTIPGAETKTLTRHVFIKAEASTDLPFVTGTPAEGSTVTLENFRVGDRNGETTISGDGKTGGKVKVWNYKSKDRLVIKAVKPEDRILTVDENGKWSGVGELRDQGYELFIEYFAPGADLDGAPTSSLTRTFTAVAPAGK